MFGVTSPSRSSSQLEVGACTGDASQKFTLANATRGYYAICSSSDTSKCLDIDESHGSPGGPAVQLYPFHGGSNELFKFNSDTTVTDRDAIPLCFASRAVVPPPAYSENYQVWAKPLPNAAVAVFVLSNGVTTPQAVPFTFTEVGLKATTATVRDVWGHKDLPDASGSFSTDSFGGVDSRFYVLTPKA